MYLNGGIYTVDRKIIFYSPWSLLGSPPEYSPWYKKSLKLPEGVHILDAGMYGFWIAVVLRV
jgi:hypothetical protein